MHPPFLKLRDEIWGAQEASYFPLLFWRADNGKNSIDGELLETSMELSNPTRTSCATWSWLGYDSSMSKWQRMKPFTTPAHVKNVIIGSKGLVCLRGEDSLFVVNPMTGGVQEVPMQENIVELVVNEKRNTFKLISAGSRKRTKIYDSETRVWSKRGRPAPNLALSHHTGAFCDGVLYCVAREERTSMLGVTGYAVEGSRTWSDVCFFPGTMGETCLKAKVMQFQGEVFALLKKEISEDDIGPKTMSLSLWGLDRKSLKWKLAGTMPWALRQHLINLDDFDCVAHNNQISIFNKGTFKAVECRVSSGGVVTSWQELPLDSYSSAGLPLVERIIVNFGFDPSLLTAV